MVSPQKGLANTSPFENIAKPSAPLANPLLSRNAIASTPSVSNVSPPVNPLSATTIVGPPRSNPIHPPSTFNGVPSTISTKLPTNFQNNPTNINKPNNIANNGVNTSNNNINYNNMNNSSNNNGNNNNSNNNNHNNMNTSNNNNNEVIINLQQELARVSQLLNGIVKEKEIQYAVEGQREDEINSIKLKFKAQEQDLDLLRKELFERSKKENDFTKQLNKLETQLLFKGINTLINLL